ncbi:hypothetical protein DICPUDRAFT_158635 [Dictyostelium purpureum]|uniref:Uncharacterized protein n=1 Tax=Dictyostelium purpureum TaxID=5786 RepID=F1A242_DICPU|nr:uncharacterized protein DICPUDRAFT_158635 [Dictyostelium purpureum]EGC29745.1 hypothetical protein DICPUDRAFT_158635 [Dictyostelium purpureum]|eukprot:XP_003293738.1 hypothetical protein DICPUDRAFT_158635 [Dictyostelium purpureum]
MIKPFSKYRLISNNILFKPNLVLNNERFKTDNYSPSLKNLNSELKGYFDKLKNNKPKQQQQKQQQPEQEIKPNIDEVADKKIKKFSKFTFKNDNNNVYNDDKNNDYGNNNDRNSNNINKFYKNKSFDNNNIYNKKNDHKFNNNYNSNMNKFYNNKNDTYNNNNKYNNNNNNTYNNNNNNNRNNKYSKNNNFDSFNNKREKTEVNLPNANIELKYLQSINKINKQSDFWVEFKKELKERPQELFKNRENHLKYLKYFSTVTPEVQFLNYETWYRIRRINFLKNGGKEFLDCYNGDYIEAIISNFPQYNWKRFRFPTCPKSYWLKDENVIEYIEWLVKTTKKDINNKDDWHYISKKDFIRNHGQYLISEYETVNNIFLKYYPDHSWKSWLFEKFPKDYFEENENIKKFIIWLGQEILHFKTWEDYYNLKLSDFKKNNGFRIIKEFDKSVYLLVSEVLKDEYKWVPWKFRIIPKKYVNEQILLKYFDHLLKELGVETREQLIEYEKNDPTLVQRTEGTQIINEFGGSIEEAYKKLEVYRLRVEETIDEDDDEDSFDDNYEFDNLEDIFDDSDEDSTGQDQSVKESKKSKKRKINPLKLK